MPRQTPSALSPDEQREALRTTAEFLSDSAAILNRTPPRSARMTIVTVSALLASAIALSVLMPVERVVSARGRIATDTPHIVVQPLETSIVREILVREGQRVTRGQVLATLDPTFSRADQTSVSRQVASLSAEVERLQAEIDGRDYQPRDGDSFGQLQRRFFLARKAQIEAALANSAAKLAALETSQAQMTATLAFNRQRLALSQEGDAIKGSMADRKLTSRMDAMKAKDWMLEVSGTVRELEGKLESGRHDIEAVRAQMDDQSQQWRSETMGQLVKQQGALNAAAEELNKADKRHDLIELRAPDDAVVLQLGDISIGSVAQTAQKMFTLVPEAAGLEVEAEIATADQGFVQLGQKVDVKLDAWPFGRYGGLHGEVRSISPDSMTSSPEAGGTSAAARTFYIARIAITDPRLRVTPADFRLMPGMTLTADVQVGDQTIAAYLFDGAMPVITEGMREP